MTELRVFARIASRNVLRRPLRSVASILGVALAVFLFSSIESLGRGFHRALDADGSNRALIVYRANRYCPQTSRLPEQYRETIRAIPGVLSVLPVRVYMNNCRANLDLVLFQGTDATALSELGSFDVLDGSAEAFVADPGSALVGESFASRRGVHRGDTFRFGLVDVKIAGIFRDKDPVKNGVVYTHLPYLQRILDSGKTGIVTQFEVRVGQDAKSEDVARAIDAALSTREAPTQTFMRSEFLKRETAELSNLIDFARIFGRVCVLVLCVLLLNAALLATEERTREHALFCAIGYDAAGVFAMLLLESGALTLAGAALGAIASLVVASTLHLTIGIEGIPIALDPRPLGFLLPVGITLAAALAASAIPAWLATRVDVAAALRA